MRSADGKKTDAAAGSCLTLTFYTVAIPGKGLERGRFRNANRSEEMKALRAPHRRLAAALPSCAVLLAAALLPSLRPAWPAPRQSSPSKLARERGDAANQTGNRNSLIGNTPATRQAALHSLPTRGILVLRAPREVAVTFDDLPAPADSVVSDDPTALQAMTARLLAELKQCHVPAIGFVNEGKLNRGDFAQRVDILKMWVDAGFPLGNHTYSHADLDAMPLAAYELDFLRGEMVTEPLLRSKGMRERYFRYPYLDVGATPGAQRAFKQFLARQGYTIAPVTIDNQEYMFAAVYAHAMAAGDTVAADRVAASFLSYMNDIFGYFEKFSSQTLGYEPRQVLLLHADELDTDTLGDLVKMLRARGYRFITLRDALFDPAYHQPDRYDDSDDGGVSWIEHWAFTMHKDVLGGPDPPAYIQSAYNKLQ
jgi:peptidoglycan/xylan/chitin deacetylase (PgdA/CDA1 family)